MKIFAIIISALLISTITFGSAILGGSLSMDCMGGSYYRTTVNILNDCAGPDASDSVLVHYKCMGQDSLSFSKYAYLIQGTSYGAGSEVISHDTALTTCNGGNSLGYKYYIYQGMVNVNPNYDWKIYISDLDRANVNSCYSSANHKFYLETNLYLGISSNSTPYITDYFYSIVYVDELSEIRLSFQDVDGDSLSYELISPMTDSITPINYKRQYSATNFIPSTTPITLDPITGGLSFTPSSKFTGITKLQISEWRSINGQMQLITTSQMDLMFHAYEIFNSPPVLSGMDFDLKAGYSDLDTIYTKEFHVGDAIKFKIHAYDPDSGLNVGCGSSDIWIEYMNEEFPSANISVINNNTDSSYLYFVWVPTESDISSEPYLLNLVVGEHWAFALSSGINNFQYKIIIKAPVSIKENNNDKANFSIYPNPVNSIVNILFDKTQNNIEVILYDILGNQMLNNIYSTSDEIQFSVAEFPKGSYFIKVISDNIVIKTKKLVMY